ASNIRKTQAIFVSAGRDAVEVLRYGTRASGSDPERSHASTLHALAVRLLNDGRQRKHRQRSIIAEGFAKVIGNDNRVGAGIGRLRRGDTIARAVRARNWCAILAP